MNTTSALGWSLLHFLWQGTLIALLAKLALAMLPRGRAAARYAVALGALSLMPLMVGVTAARALRGPVSPLPFELAHPALEPATHASIERAPETAPAPSAMLESSSSTRDDASPALTVAPTRSWKQRVDVFLPWIVGAWALGVVALALRLITSFGAVQRMVRAPREPVSGAVEAVLVRLSNRLGVRRTVRVCASALTRVPAVAGWLRPVILLPASALTGLSRTQLEAVLAHELAHVRRHDYLVNLLQTLVETLLFYHPAVWWLGARIREEREHCCDDLAVAACGSAPLYAEALLSMEELRRSPELALAFSRGSLVGRIERLLAPGPRNSELYPRWIAGLSAVAIVTLFAASSSLAEAARASQREQVKQEERRVRRADVPTDAGEVRLAPDAAQPLSVRSEWARRTAAEQRYREYWVGHAIAPNPVFPNAMLMGRFDHVGGLVIGDGESTVTLMGGLMTSDADELDLPGVPLAPLVNAAGDDVAVLYLWSGSSNRAMVRRVHVATARLPVDLEGLPVLWLGRASDRDSVEEALALMDRAPDDELRGDFVGAVGVHADSAVVVPELTRILGAKGLADEVRSEAAEWLARHPGMEALRALDAAARGDRSEEVRAEAAESVADMQYGPAFDVLVALTRELTDPEARAEAVEGLGERSEPAAVSVLLDLANDPDEDVRSEAVETLGEVPDGAGLSALSALARSHQSVDVRREAIETYGECAPTEEALGLLQELARRDPDSEARCEAVETLGEIQDGRVVGILGAIVDESDSLDVQREAVETLGETIAGADVVPLLERIARTHREIDIEREAVETLGELHGSGGRVLDILASIAGDHPSEEVRSEAVETLGECSEPARATQLLQRLLESERSKRVRKEIQETLEELREVEDEGYAR